jgi:hypothetical protein
MEDWKRRYEHERDVRDSLLASLGLPGLEDKVFGVLTPAPKSAWMRFDGPKFWPIMKAKGHTSTVFEDCACRRGGE